MLTAFGPLSSTREYIVLWIMALIKNIWQPDNCEFNSSAENTFIECEPPPKKNYRKHKGE